MHSFGSRDATSPTVYEFSPSHLAPLAPSADSLVPDFAKMISESTKHPKIVMYSKIVVAALYDPIQVICHILKLKMHSYSQFNPKSSQLVPYTLG
jgi:hypothetical protein